MRFRKLGGPLAVAVAMMIVAGGLQACSRDHAGTTTSAQSPTSAAPAAPPLGIPSPTASPAHDIEVPSTAQVIAVATGAATTLYRVTGQAAAGARFVGGGVEIFAGGTPISLRLDGSPAPPGSLDLQCLMNNGHAVISGRDFPGVACGTFSPDRRWMTYAWQTGQETLPNGNQVPLWSQSVLALDTGTARQIAYGLVDCGGCDSRYGPVWSPSSRYVAYAESGGGQRRFLSDLSTWTTRVIGSGAGSGDAPAWSPKGNVLVYPMDKSETITRLEDLDNGTASDSPLEWPVRFDSSGRFLYSPAWDKASGSGGDLTTIFEIAAGRVIATLSGVPPERFVWNSSRAVGIYQGGYVAVLQRAKGCDGTAIYVQGVAAPRCISGGEEGQISPDGSLVAIARNEGTIGPAYGPGFQLKSMTRYSIVVVDLTGGTDRTLLTDAVSYGPSLAGSMPYGAPLVLWSDTGTHLLVLWPYWLGL